MNNISYFKSEYNCLKANAAIFTGSYLISQFIVSNNKSLPIPGFLLGNLNEAGRKYITKEHVCGGMLLDVQFVSHLSILDSSTELVRLIRDPDVTVRLRASEAMSFLQEY